MKNLQRPMGGGENLELLWGFYKDAMNMITSRQPCCALLFPVGRLVTVFFSLAKYSFSKA